MGKSAVGIGGILSLLPKYLKDSVASAMREPLDYLGFNFGVHRSTGEKGCIINDYQVQIRRLYGVHCRQWRIASIVV